MTRRRRLQAAVAAFAAAGLAYALWIEPRAFLLRDRVTLPLPAAPLSAVHLSDLHIRGDAPVQRRLLAAVAEERPDVILLSGDLIRDVPTPRRWQKHKAATVAFVAALRRIAPVYGVQGHSEHRGDLVAALADAGVEWLDNEGRRIGPDGGILLVGVNQQVGEDRFGRRWSSPFRAVEIAGRRLLGATAGEPFRPSYAHYDPGLELPAWSGCEVTCAVRVSGRKTGAGLVLHSRYVTGEDRFVHFRRDGSRWGTKSFSFLLHGTDFTNPGAVRDTGIDPLPDRWYRMKVRTEVEPGVVRARAKVWEDGRPEPPEWQAHGEDRSSHRLLSGTVGLFASGGGTVVYRDLEVRDQDGKLLLGAPLVVPRGERLPPGFRAGTRDTRLAMALARSPRVPAGTPVVVLSHVPDVALEASTRGIDAVLAGHTHGGQVRLPVIGALTTRTVLGPYYDRGLFYFSAPNPSGQTRLYINSGVGMSVLPLRFLCPPRWAVVEMGTPRPIALPGERRE